MRLKSTERCIAAPRSILSPLSPFAHKVDICSPGMKQNCEKMLTWRIFSRRGWWGWVNFWCEVKEYYTLHCCPEVDLKPLSPFAHKVDICSPGMKQNCEKILNQRFFSWRGWWGWVNFLCEVKVYYALHCCPEVDLNPCYHLPIKWTFLHLEWSKIVKNADLAIFFLERMVGLGKLLVWC